MIYSKDFVLRRVTAASVEDPTDEQFSAATATVAAELHLSARQVEEACDSAIVERMSKVIGASVVATLITRLEKLKEPK